MLVAGEGLGEDVTNGAATPPIVAAAREGTRKNRAGESQREKGKAEALSR